jgi:hypothetical protein
MMLAAAHSEALQAASHGASASERLLADETERALRAPEGRVALALHLSRLKAPAPRPHHTRIARALLQDMAMRLGGQVFAMRNGDIVLLCGAEAVVPEGQGLGEGLGLGQGLGSGGGRRVTPAALPVAFARLFGADSPEPGRLTSLWRLEADAAPFRDYISNRQADRAPPEVAAEDGGGVALVTAVDVLIDSMATEEMLALQTAVRVLGGGPMPLSSRLSPLFREFSFSLDRVLARPDLVLAAGDPFLLRHFAARLDGRMMGHLLADLEGGGKLTRPGLRGQLPLHVNMTLDGVVSPEFARLARAAARQGVRFGIEISLSEAAADPVLLAAARQLLDAVGFALVLDGVDHVALTMTHPGALKPALVKLVWSPRLADSAPGVAAAVDAALARIGPERIVLARADGEQALVWGQSRGIARYQGFFLDAVQAARRIAVCHSARPCSLRQCLTRAGTLQAAIRVGCGNPGLLDMAVDAPARPG